MSHVTFFYAIDETDRQDRTEILLKVAVNTINLNINLNIHVLRVPGILPFSQRCSSFRDGICFDSFSMSDHGTFVPFRTKFSMPGSDVSHFSSTD
jgi:hypothetical protein